MPVAAWQDGRKPREMSEVLIRGAFVLLPDGKSDLTQVQQILMCIPQASMLGIYSICAIRLEINNELIAGD
jgi:hypothetical protein